MQRIEVYPSLEEILKKASFKKIETPSLIAEIIPEKAPFEQWISGNVLFPTVSIPLILDGTKAKLISHIPTYRLGITNKVSDPAHPLGFTGIDIGPRTSAYTEAISGAGKIFDCLIMVTGGFPRGWFGFEIDRHWPWILYDFEITLKARQGQGRWIFVKRYDEANNVYVITLEQEFIFGKYFKFWMINDTDMILNFMFVLRFELCNLPEELQKMKLPA